MTKISELLPIQGNSTKTGDLFVTVNLDLGEQGTRNITRKELANAIQREDLTSINVSGGSIRTTEIENSEIINSSILNPNVSLSNQYQAPISSNDYFILKDVALNTTVSVTFEQLQNELSNSYKKSSKRYISDEGNDNNDGSYLKPYRTLEKAVEFMQSSNRPVSITVLPGVYFTFGNLALPDSCSIVSSNGQYATTIVMNGGSEENNLFLMGSGCYIQGFSVQNQRVDEFENPSSGFIAAFRPGATITRSPYIRDVSQISNYFRENISAPLDQANANPAVGRGGGVVLADRSVLNSNTIFPYMLCFAATPRSPNGIGYVAKNGAGINGISSISIFSRCSFYALNGGQITLNNSATQFGDISMRSKGFTPVVIPNTTTAALLVSAGFANTIDSNTQLIVDYMWADLLSQGYTSLNEVYTRRDAANFLKSISNDFRTGNQSGARTFIAGLFDYKGDYVFNATISATFNAFIRSYEQMRNYIISNLAPTAPEIVMLNGLVNNVVIGTLQTPQRQNFGSLIESLAHQFNQAGAGVNTNALPVNFRRVGKPISAESSILIEAGGRIRWSGSDELNNQFLSKGLKINGKTGRIEGKSFTSSVRRIARRAANSRI